MYTQCSCSTKDTSPVRQHKQKPKHTNTKTLLNLKESKAGHDFNFNVTNPQKSINFEHLNLVSNKLNFNYPKKSYADTNCSYFWNPTINQNFNNIGHKNSKKSEINGPVAAKKEKNFVLGYELSKKERRKIKAKIKNQSTFVLKPNVDPEFENKN